MTEKTAYSRINTLDAFLANQIAAGEVVERPSSVIKELLENSFDAGATQIEITIENGGLKLIKIRDDGSGIYKDDLPLALNRYATSKIKSFEDLMKISSLGFRGEALASIASVSRLSLTSRTSDADSGWQINVEGFLPDSCKTKPAVHLRGTTVEVRDLFFNVPARRKFLRSEQTEFNRIDETVKRSALSKFDVAISLRHNGSMVLQLARSIDKNEQDKRVATICGKQFLENSITMSAEINDIKLHGWIGLPIFTRSQMDMQYFYLNGRMIRDKLINQALRHAYRDVIPHNRYPAVVLYLEMAPELVDVNVHPTKSEVRFKEGKVVYDFLVASVKKALASVRPREHIELFALRDDDLLRDRTCCMELTPAMNTASRSCEEECEARPRNLNSSCGEYISQVAQNGAEQQLSFSIEEEMQQIDFAKAQTVCEEVAEYKTSQQIEPQIQKQLFAATSSSSSCAQENKCPLGFALAQLHDVYILAQNSLGLILVDTHAACERINYEKLQRDFLHAALEKQELLAPIDLVVSVTEANCVENNLDFFQQMGFEIIRSAKERVALKSVPVLLTKADIAALIHDIIADLLALDSSFRIEECYNKILATMACHGSIRGKRKMTESEMNHLLRSLEVTERGSQCGHGRPTWIQLTVKEVDKLFQRSSR